MKRRRELVDVPSRDEAFVRTIETGEAHHWSRSRQRLWRKGAASGFVQKIVELRIDDDQDAVSTASSPRSMRSMARRRSTGTGKR